MHYSVEESRSLHRGLLSPEQNRRISAAIFISGGSSDTYEYMQAFPLWLPDGCNRPVSIMREEHAEERETDGGEEREERKKETKE